MKRPDPTRQTLARYRSLLRAPNGTAPNPSLATPGVHSNSTRTAGFPPSGQRPGRVSALRRRISLALTALCPALAALALTTTPALGATSHVFTSTFGAANSTPANPYPLVIPTGVAVDNSTGSSAHDIYVTDPADHRVEKFDSSGNFILMFGKDVDQTTGGNVCTAASGDTCQDGAAGSSAGEFTTPTFLAVDGSSGPSSGDVYVGDTGDNFVSKFESSGNLITSWGAGGQQSGFNPLYGVAVDPSGNLFVLSESAFWYEQSGIFHSDFGYPRGTSPIGLAVDAEDHLYKADGSPEITKLTDTGAGLGEPDTSGSTSGFTIDPSTNDLYAVESGSFVDHFALNCGQGCSPLDSFGSGHLEEAEGIAIDATSDDAYVANSGGGDVAAFDGAGPYVTTGSYSNLTQTTATVSGHVDPAGRGDVTECRFEYGATASYGGSVPCSPNPESNPPLSNFTDPTDVTANISGLQAGTTYHYRLVASNSNGNGNGNDQTFGTVQPPSIDGLSSSDLTKTTAELHAKINPNGVDTTYHFEYGPTEAYGSSVPVPAEDIGSSETVQSVTANLAGLESGVVYHFRVVATNAYGTATSADQTFNFLPPNCPNAAVRQQTGGEFLPDCRAYELVSPENAGNVIFFPASSPSAPYATNPARFAFGGGLGGVEGTEPTNSIGIDTYVATRTANGWVTHYIGIPGSQTLGTNDVVGDRSFDKFIDFKSNEGFGGVPQPISKAPYVWDFTDNFLERWPANVTSIPNGDSTIGAFQPSPDFSHLAFSSNNVDFAPGGSTVEGGSAYDYDTSSKVTKLISIAEDGSNIVAGEGSFIEFPPINSTYGFPVPQGPDEYPGVSTDGSHILMSTGAQCEQFYGCPQGPTKLYMRVNDAVTYDVSRGHEVTYVGMTEDGSKVFFTSSEQLTPEDQDTSTDLYMWSEATNSLTLISKGNNGAGNTDACDASWTSQCDVIPVIGAIKTDDSIAAESGDIYFYSPEQLDASKGLADNENLYVYRGGEVHFVASMTPGIACAHAAEEETCANGPLSRIQVSPDGDHTAFVTASHLSSYDNAGFQEMYTYEPSTEKIQCVSCIPNGDPPTGEVTASLDGLFMSNDGRTFFYTPDALVPQDTNHLHDVYEFVEGRPQLITTGTGFEDTQTTPNQVRAAGLEGVSADGINVYFSTYETLVPQDHNGQFMKFYDARTDGGFPYVPPAPPCEAADECHGAGSSPAGELTVASEADLGAGGNAVRARKKAKHRKARHRVHRKSVHHGRHPARRHG